MPWDHWYDGTRTVVFGHWARRGLVSAPRMRGLDSGCVYGGPLTAWIAEEDRLVQAPGQDVRW
jgi:bis(5'-nucleosyl)-tetraphosphatase (symmetrical)